MAQNQSDRNKVGQAKEKRCEPMPEAITEYEGFCVGDEVRLKSWDEIVATGKSKSSDVGEYSMRVWPEDGTSILHECHKALSGVVAAIEGFEAGLEDGTLWALLRPLSDTSKRTRDLLSTYHFPVQALELLNVEGMREPAPKEWEEIALGGDCE